MSSIDQQGSSLGLFPTSPFPFIPTLISLRAFDLVSSLVWWETLANIGTFFPKDTPEPFLDFGLEPGSAKGTMADLRHLGYYFRLGYLRVGELYFCLLCNLRMAQDLASSLSRKLAYVPGPTFGFVKLLASSGSHCTKWADEQHRPAGFESRLVPDLPLLFIPTLIGLRVFDLVPSRV